MPIKPVEPYERFKSKYVITESGCWQWTAGVSVAGYAKFHVGTLAGRDRATIGGHRWSYEYFVGPIPEGLAIDHLCRNRGCVNPEHLEAVTHKTNVLRGEGPPALNATKQLCKHGHPLEGDNLYVTPDGRRRCRECSRISARRSARSPARLASQAKYRESGKRGEYEKQYRESNIDSLREYQRNWRREHPETRRQWVDNNREQVREYDRNWKKERRKEQRSEND